MKRMEVLMVDAVLNLILGFLLIAFPFKLIELLGMPMAEHSFYLSIFGGVLIGIGIALLIEYFRGPTGIVGLGIGGAMSINLCFALVVAGWLVSGKLIMPLRGEVILWILVVILTAISGIESITYMRKKKDAQPGA